MPVLVGGDRHEPSVGEVSQAELDAAVAALVALAGAQTITGVKDFAADPIFNDAAIPQEKVVSLVADLAARPLDADVVHRTGDETVGGAKTFEPGPSKVMTVQDVAFSPPNVSSWGVARRLRVGASLATADASEHGVVVQTVAAASGSTVSYQKNAVFVRMFGDDPSGVGQSFDAVALDARGEARANGARVWASYMEGRVFSGVDGKATGLEIDIRNDGADQPTPGSTTGKHALLLVPKGAFDATSAIEVRNNGTDLRSFHKVLWARQNVLGAGATDTFIEIDDSGTTVMAILRDGKIGIGVRPLAALHFADGQNARTGTATGSQWATDAAQKQAWWGGTPDVQPPATTPVNTLLERVGFRAVAGVADSQFSLKAIAAQTGPLLNLLSNSDVSLIEFGTTSVTFADGYNINAGSGAGLQIGGASSRLSFFGLPATAQPALGAAFPGLIELLGLRALGGASNTRMNVDGLAGQTGDLLRFRDSAGTALLRIISDGRVQTVAANEQTTVGVAGAASAPPLTPSKYMKVRDSAGANMVIPMYNA